jgi:predicted DNA binding CopG/RHH family protein
MMKGLKLPQTDSIEELARFWDTHDLTEFEEELEEVTEPVFERKPDTVIPLRLQPQELEAVKRVAQARGVAEATLLREWVLEKLHGSV